MSAHEGLGHALLRRFVGRRIKHLPVAALLIVVSSSALTGVVTIGLMLGDKLDRTHEIQITTAKLEEQLAVIYGVNLVAVRSVMAASSTPRTSRWFLRLLDRNAGDIGVAECTLDRDQGLALCNVVLPSGVKRDSVVIMTRAITNSSSVDTR